MSEFFPPPPPLFFVVCVFFSGEAVGQNRFEIPFWLGLVNSPPIFRAYFSGDWDVHWGYGVLTHGRESPFSGFLGNQGNQSLNDTDCVSLGERQSNMLSHSTAKAWMCCGGGKPPLFFDQKSNGHVNAGF